ncbi:hypothetical protein EDD22DRAFT_992651 [Suillus occidentalis]|nr:hypothetical protein EDD22DRAFT_992651 [Suillus occidentalis]
MHEPRPKTTLEYEIGRWVGGQKSSSAWQMGMGTEKKKEWGIRSQVEVLYLHRLDGESSISSPYLFPVTLASYEADRILGSGEVIGKLRMSWDDVLNHGGEPFDLSFPPMRVVRPSLSLKAAVLQACNDQDSALPDIARLLDIQMQATRNLPNVLRARRHPDHAAALTNLAWARLEGYIQDDLQEIDTTISLFRDALALRPQCHLDRTDLRHNGTRTAADIREAAQVYHELLPLCPEGTYLRSIAADEDSVDYVIAECNNLPTDASDEGIRLERIVLELCAVVHQHHPRILDQLSNALKSRFTHSGNIDHFDECL